MAAGGVLVGRGYVSIRPEFEGDWSRQASARASRAGRSAGGGFSRAFGAGVKGIGVLAGVAVAANLQNVAAASAVLAPALATAGTAAAALKLGLSGVGDAFKAAFSDSTADASAAASATRAVESAQRGLANAQRALADARVQAAERVREAQESVRDAERDLADSQREARQVQGELNDARREAARALEDMNQRLAESQLDEREAVLRLKEAEEELRAAQQKPGLDPDELARLQIARDRAALNLKEQRRDTQRLAEDTKKANKTGVEGSSQVLSVRERIADANRTVADRERALAEAHADVDKARAEGARSIEDAQRGVAEAAAALADAQSAAAAQTSKLDQAMAKLAPNAKSFVNAIRGLAPAWTAMRMSVQNRLFEGLDSTVTGLARQTIPILQTQLTATAGIWNAMAKSAAGAVSQMARSGMLEQILQGANRSFAQLKDVPGQLINSFGILATAAQPAFEKLMGGFAGAIANFEAGLARGFASGGLEEAINTAFEILSQFGQLLGNVLGTVSQIFKAASDAGGQIVGALSAAFGELRRVLALPEVQAQLRTIFASVAQVVSSLVPVLGAVVQAVVPLLAAIAPAVAQIATAVGPVLSQLATQLSAALLPIVQTLGPVLVQLVTSLTSALGPVISALLPVVTQVGVALLQIVSAVTPLLAPIGQLIASVITALAPALTPIISIVTQLVQVLVGPLTSIIQALTPALVLVADVIAQVFQAVTPLLAPLVDLIGQVAVLLAGVFSQALTAVMGAVAPLIPVGIQLVESVLGALAPVLPILGEALGGIAEAFGSLLGPLAGVFTTLGQQLAPVIAQITPIFAELASILAGALAAVLPILVDVLVILFDALSPIFPLISEILGIFVGLAASVLGQLLPPLLQLVQVGLDLVVALLPILPPIAELVGLVVGLAVSVLSWLLPPLVKLASFLIGILAGALGAVIGWIASAVSWVMDKLGPAFTWLYEKVIQPVWRAIEAVIKWVWETVLRPVFRAIGDWISKTLAPKFAELRDAFRFAFEVIKVYLGNVWTKDIKPIFNAIRDAVGKVGESFGLAKDAIARQWAKLQDIAKKPIAFVINTVYNKGIVGVWNKIAGAFGAPKLAEFHPKGFATGGVLPGYTPGRDVHKYYSPTGGALELSGGEAIMRPEFTRAVGGGFVGYFNRLAKSSGAGGVRRALAPVLGGNPRTSTDRTLRYADGGIFSWIGKGASALAGAGSTAWNGIKKGAKWLADTLEQSARAGASAVVDPLLKNFPGVDTGFGAMLSRIPGRMLDALFGYSKTADAKGVGGLGGPRIQAALKWARTQNGLPYQWGGNGDPSWDCSGFMSAIESVIRGQKPHRRWSTHAFNGGVPPGWVRNGNSPFRVGITHAGVGHTAGTLGKTNVESRGGDGVVVGPRARGYKDGLFTSWYGFMPGKYDAGGWLGPGQAGVNQLRQPEAVLTPGQWRTMSTLAAAGGAARFEGDLYLDSGEFLGRVRGEASHIVDSRLSRLSTTLRAGRRD
ncbi:hypothetical protein AB0C77_06550 [Streptomyces sp. NPDC048629]|uniref:hypothetical protein n=1 Tax=Streptomyces sp. NPDC048629 TaxID=3154824 RepID=UPI00343E8942